MKKVLVLAIIAAVFGSVFYFDLFQYLSLETFEAQRENIEAWKQENTALAVGGFFAIYVAVTGFSLPGAAILTLVAGALFGLGLGLLIVSFASSLGALCAFLVSRTLLRDWVQSKFSGQLEKINKGVERDGNFYLFTLRLVPAVPFFVINLAMGLTSMRPWPFYWVSQVGMLAGTAVYVNAGTQLGELEAGEPILTPELIGSFVLLAIFPWLVKGVMAVVKYRRATKGFKKPKTFDYNVIVIGAGSGGLVSALIAATVKAKVALIERHKMGGDCLNTGCVPSKAIIRSAHIADNMRRAEDFGLAGVEVKADFQKVMNRVQSVIKKIEPHDSVERYTDMGVECIQGDAKFVSPWEVDVGGKVISARRIILASGARPAVPPIEGVNEVGYLTSDTLWELDEQPEHLLVIGAGPIGCELAQSFRRLGSKVSLIDLAILLPREDDLVRDVMQKKFESEGIDLYMESKPVRFYKEGDQKKLILEVNGEERTLDFDQVLIAVGRKANTEGMDIEKIGIRTVKPGVVNVNERLQTDCPTVYACGDVIGPYQFTHTASHEAWFASVNALFGPFKQFEVDYSVIPWATFTDPEVAQVGVNEKTAQEKGLEYDVTRYGIDDLDRNIAEGEAHGFVQVLTAKGSDKILGVTIVGYHASDLLQEFILAMKHNLGLKKIMGTIHPYPTLGEANKFAASEWQKARKPEKLLSYVEKFHDFMR